MKPENSYTPGIFTIGMLFFICGFTTWLNATLIPFLKVACELSNFHAYFVTFVFYLAYAAVVVPSLRMLGKAEHKNGIMIGLMAMAAGALIFIPAALLRTYALFLAGLLVAGAGLGLLQVSVSPYVAAPGAAGNALRRRSAMSICSKVAGIVSTLAVGSALFHKIDSLEASIQIAIGASRAAELDTLAHKIVAPCLVTMLMLLAAAFWVKFSPFPDVGTENGGAQKEEDVQSGSVAHLLRFWFGALALFLSVGVEIIAVVSIALYGKSMDISLETAKILPAGSLLAAILGCWLGVAAVPKLIGRERMLAICAALGVVFSLAAVSISGKISIAFVALLGLSGSLAWSFVFSSTVKEAGRYVRAGSAIFAISMLGGALLPLAYGYLADTVGNRHAYWLLLPCYAAILLYAVANFPVAKNINADK
ncbi:MAG: glucose/galactose MFS transporter [Prevotellaceae bacterium]|jgi:fucose permease|nr:glucose/galactose MFS transporter [Prevotellaceae bacterium]